MRLRHWLMSAVLAAAPHIATASADEPARASPAAVNPPAPRASKEVKANDGHTTGATEPLVGSYQFLLEVAGVTPGERTAPEDRSYSVGPRLHPDPRTVDSDD